MASPDTLARAHHRLIRVAVALLIRRAVGSVLICICKRKRGGCWVCFDMHMQEEPEEDSYNAAIRIIFEPLW